MVIQRDLEKKVLWTTAVLMMVGAIINSVYTLISIKFTPERLKLLINITVVEMPILIGIAMVVIHNWFKPVTEFFDELEDKGEGKVSAKIAMKARRLAIQLPQRLVLLEFMATITVGLSAGGWMRVVYGHLSTGESVAIFASTLINSINVVVILFYLISKYRRPLLNLTTYAQENLDEKTDERKGERKAEGVGIALKTQIAVVSVMLLALFFGSIMFINQTSKILETRLYEQAKLLVNNTAQKIILLNELNKITTEDIGVILSKNKMGENGCSVILNQSGEIIYGKADNAVIEAIKVMKTGEDMVEEVRLGCTLVATNIKPLNSRLVTVFFTKDFNAPVNRLWTLLLIFTLITIVIGNLYAYLITHDIASPIQVLISSSRKVAGGDLSHTVSVDTEDEIGVLGTIFNRMIENLRNTMNEINKTSAVREDEKQKLHDGIIRILDIVEAVDRGDLSREIKSIGQGEIVQLSDSINKMLSELRKLIKQVQEVGLHLGSAGNELFATAQQLSTGSTEQASSIAEITATVEELATTSGQIAENSDSVVKVAEEAFRSVRGGQESVNNVINNMVDIRDKVKEGCKRILALGEKSQRIGDVLEIINHIADETKLIAFNAAIEASRAGEFGKGFSVVAVEVRKLAENVVESTKTIKEIVSEIQSLANSSVMATEEQTRKVEQGVELTQKAGESISEILDMVEHTTKSAKQISIATQQQRTASEQIVQTMREVAEVSKQSAAGSKQTANAASELSTLAEDLKQMIGKFKVEKA